MPMIGRKALPNFQRSETTIMCRCQFTYSKLERPRLECS